jgi:hypothetical protein
MTVSKVFKSPEGCEMVQCTWFDKKPREYRAASVIDFLEAAIAGLMLYRSLFCRTLNGTPVVPVSLME